MGAPCPMETFSVSAGHLSSRAVFNYSFARSLVRQGGALGMRNSSYSEACFGKILFDVVQFGDGHGLGFARVDQAQRDRSCHHRLRRL